MARILAVYAITPLEGVEGELLEPDVKFTTQTTRFVPSALWPVHSSTDYATPPISHVEPIHCDISPRDEKARALVENACCD